MKKLLTKKSTLAFAATLSLAFNPQLIHSADHGDGPTVDGDQAGDLADVYAFLDPNDNDQVVLITTLRGFIVPSEANNFGVFEKDVRVTFQIENTGDAIPDLFLDVTFNQPQRPIIPVPKSDPPVTPDVAGFKNKPRSTQDAIVSFRGALPTNLKGPGGKFTGPVTQPTLGNAPSPAIITPLINDKNPNSIGSLFAGPRNDPFFFDIPGFNRFVASVLSGNVNPAELDRGRDSFAGYNIMAVALRLPASTLRGLKPGAPTVLGVNAITSRKNERIVKGDKVGSGAYQQLDRIGVPGVNVAFLPYNMKNAYNGGTTIDDSKGKFFSAIAGTLTALGTNAQNIGTLASVTGLPQAFPIPKGGALGTGDFLRLQTDKAVKPNPAMGGSTAGGGSDASNGFPNGRRLRDDVIDTVLFLVTNGVITAGDHVNASEVPPTDTFPFVAPPTQPFINGVTDDQTRN